MAGRRVLRQSHLQGHGGTVLFDSTRETDEVGAWGRARGLSPKRGHSLAGEDGNF